MPKRVLFVLNPISGANRKPAKIAHWIDHYWKDSGISYEIAKTGHRGHGKELALLAAAKGYDIVVAAGGDGTINEIGQGLIGSETALGIIPAGSGNGFARNLNIPLNQKAAIKMLREPRFIRIDVGKINQHYFFNVAGAGIDAVISARFDRSRMRGPIPYIVFSILEFFRFKPKPISIQLSGKEILRRPLLVTFANLPEFGANAVIAPNARPDDGMLDVCIFNPISKIKALFSVPKLFSGKLNQLSELEIYQTSKVIMTRLDDGPIHTDGNPHHEVTVLSIEVLPRKLKVAVSP